MADEAANQSAGTVETKAETTKSPLEFTRHWLQAIELASESEKDWRSNVKETLERYRKTKSKSFNVLYANTQTVVPALYNSEPIPDIRRRFGEDDPIGKNAADMIERLLSIQAELYDFDGTMKAAVLDRQLAGRGISRVRVVLGANGSKHIECEPVKWDDYRRGPATIRKDLPWEAFRHRMTRDELDALNKDIGPRVNLDSVVDGAEKNQKDASALPDMFKRAIVWEIWDKLAGKVYWLAESFKDGPLLVQDDPYKLRDFFCTPKPLVAVDQTDTLVPVCEFMLWKPLADEMDDLTRRIANIVAVMKMRGLYAGQFENLVSKLSGLDDGQLAAADDSARTMQEGGIDKAIWMWPIDQAIQAVQGLYEAREQAKNALYEMTGVADIMRGQTEASETLGAQQIKAQWGSLRLQDGQKDIQRFARDLFRMKADLSCQEMTFAEMQAMTGIDFMPKDPPQPPQIPPGAPQEVVQQAQMAAQQAQQQAMMQAQQMTAAVEALLKGKPGEDPEQTDLQREFKIEIETDSTIRADLSRAQQNVSGFVQGLGGFMQSVGPAVQSGFMPPEIAVEYIGAFSRNFKLGREAEALTDKWVKFLEDKAKQPPTLTPEQQKAQADQQKTQLDMQAKQQEMEAKAADRTAETQTKQQQAAVDLEMKQADLQIKREELELRRQEIALEAHASQQQHGMKMAHMAAEHDANLRNLQAEEQFNGQKRAAELQFMQDRQAAKPQANGAAQ